MEGIKTRIVSLKEDERERERDGDWTGDAELGRRAYKQTRKSERGKVCVQDQLT